MQATDLTLKIIDKKTEATRIESLYLDKASFPSYIAGQYVTIKIPRLGPAEGKSYSLSSSPHESFLRITIKEMGSFSKAILKLAPGDSITTSTPYGFFYPEPTDQTSLVFIAGGIGITPCLSILKDLTHKADTRPVYLLYSNQTEADLAFRGELEELATTNPHLTTHFFITREQPATTHFHPGRFLPTDLHNFVPDTDSAEFFLCGAMDFTKALWQGLREQDIAPHQIYTEGFF